MDAVVNRLRLILAVRTGVVWMSWGSALVVGVLLVCAIAVVITGLMITSGTDAEIDNED